MPTVDEYSLFLNGILQTAQDRITANGRLNVEDVQTLFNIAKFKDGNIDEAATAELKKVYSTHYSKLTKRAIHGLEMFIVTYDFNVYMRKIGGNWSDWYVGISTTEAIENQLFNQHRVNKEKGLWIYQTVTMVTTAQSIFHYYKENGTQGGIHGTGNTAVKIYAFKLAATPKRENPFSKVVIERPQRTSFNPNRKVHDLDPEHYRQCSFCSGSGLTTCSSCGGTGGRSESRTDYDWNNNPVYRTEWVSCYSCSGGKQTCTTCGGSGTVNK